MSRAEEITSEVRRLVMTCRSLEAQLQQSVPKKTHQEMVSKMQAAIDSLSADLGRTKKSLEETETLGGRLNALTSQISTQNESITNQNKMMESFATKMAEATVPIKVYNETANKAQVLEQRIQGMIEQSEHDALRASYSELESRLSNSVPRAQFNALEIEIANSVPKQKFEELESHHSQMIPSEQYDVATARVAELENSLVHSNSQLETSKTRISEIENSLLNSVPKDQFEAIQMTIQQMVPKEEYNRSQEKISELEATISNSVPRAEFENSRQKISELENTIANSVPRASFEELQKAFEQTVPRTELEASRQRIAELEDTLSNSVSRVSFIELHGSNEQLKGEYEASGRRIVELEAKLSDSVPKAKFEEVQTALAQAAPMSELESSHAKISELEVALASSASRYQEVQSALQQMVSKEQYESAVSRISELERTLSNSVPRSDFEEITSKMSLLRELISGVSHNSEASSSTPTPMQNGETTVSTSIKDTSPEPQPVPETPAQETATVETTTLEAAPVLEQVPEQIIAAVEPVAASSAVEYQTAEPELSIAEQVIAPETTQAADTATISSEALAPSAPAGAAQPGEIREVQSQLSEINGAQETGQKSIPESIANVPEEKGFRFSNTDFCARSGLEFLEDAERVDLSVLEQHFQNGDFERWFKEVLSDESSADSLRSIRDKNCSGEELRTQLVSVIAPKYRN